MTTYDSIKYKSTTISNLNDTGTEGSKLAVGTTAQRGSTTGQFRFNTTTGLGEYYTGSSFKIIDTPPTVSSVDDTEVDSAGGGNQTFVITGTNFQSGAVAKFIGSDGTVVTADTTTVDSLTQITAVETKSSFINAKEPYDIRVENTNGLQGTLASQINVDNAPTWTTASGGLGTIADTDTGTHSTLVASDADGDTITYAETGGTNISGAGLSLNSSTGVISGDPTDVVGDTTVSFDVRATANTKTADRSFSIIIARPKITIGSETPVVMATSGNTATKSTDGYETVTVNSDMAVYVDLWGAGGGGNYGTYGPAGWGLGSAGGHAYGQITLLAGTTYVILVGEAGTPYSRSPETTGFPDAGTGGHNQAGWGGGSTRFGLYTQSGFNITNSSSDYNNTSAVYQLIAGGGGGNTSYAMDGTPVGGIGGGTSGLDGVGTLLTYEGANADGKGGTQVAGGAGGTGGRITAGTAAGAKYSGGAGDGGGGGGGYYGGGGANGWYAMAGGGSGFLNTGGGLLTNTGFEMAITDSANYSTAPDGVRSNRPTNAGNGGVYSSNYGIAYDGAIKFTLV